MPIQYTLRENKVAPTPGTYTAQVVAQGHATEADLVARMLQRGTTLTEPDLRAMLSLLPGVIADLLAEGRTLSTGFAHFGTSLPGVFPSEEAAFDPTTHQIRARLTPGPALEKCLATQIRVERIDAARPGPFLKAVYDATTHSRNERLTPGAPVRLTGTGLKLDEAAADEGVFFQQGQANPLRSAVVVRNSPSELIVVAPPDLTGPDWTVLVRNRYHRGTDLREGSSPTSLEAS